MLQIYNTLTRSKAPFRPLEPGKVKMYVCGMTVYDYCHVGHARVLVAFDVITRFLRAIGYDVTYVRNITDIDDKILRRADENGEAFDVLTARFIQAMHEDERRLGVLPPDMEPCATEHIGNIIDMITRLIERGHAYPADNGDVYFSVTSFPTYGRLSNKNLDELLSGVRIDVEEAKRDPRDFALWKAAKPGEVHWPSPWGAGRPGWHIECSAMSKHCLGETLDIHGGGPDLPFPHHENEIAQSECASGHTFVNVWMHAGAVRVDGEKMSKSLGNFFTIRDVLAKYHPEVVRYFLVSSHYRSAINYSEDTLRTARGALERFYATLRHYQDVAPASLDDLRERSAHAQRFYEAMEDDFGTPEALAVLFELIRDINTLRGSDDEQARARVAELKALAGLLGILQEDPVAFLQAGGEEEGGITNEEIEALIQARQDAKKARDFARADAIRAELKTRGVQLEDTREGTQWRRD